MAKWHQILELNAAGKSRADILAATGVAPSYVRSVLSRGHRGKLFLPAVPAPAAPFEPALSHVILCGEIVTAHIDHPDLKIEEIPSFMPEPLKPRPVVDPTPAPQSFSLFDFLFGWLCERRS